MEGQPPIFGGQAGEPVPTVDPKDLKAVLQIQRDATKDGVKAIGPVAFIGACTPGADAKALMYRCSMLQMFLSRAGAHMAQWVKDGEPTDVVFREVATIPMAWMGVGVPQQGFPFDAEELFRRISGTAA